MNLAIALKKKEKKQRRLTELQIVWIARFNYLGIASGVCIIQAVLR